MDILVTFQVQDENQEVPFLVKSLLVGGFSPTQFEKYARQIGSFPQVGMKITDIWNRHLVCHQRSFQIIILSYSGSRAFNF